MHEHFLQLLPTVTKIVKTRHFEKDAPDFDISLVTDSKHQNFTELHKFEETIEGNHIFRALWRHLHMVYCIDKEHRLIFLRAFNNFKEYKKFLDNKREISQIISEII